MSGERYHYLSHHFPSTSAFGASHPFPLLIKSFEADEIFFGFKRVNIVNI